MGEVLFLSHRIPFPPDRGDKIRSHHVLRRLARIAPVHVACFADDDQDIAEEFELASLALSYRLVRRTKPLVLAGLEALARRRPISLTAFHDPELAHYVEQLIAARPISTIYVFSGQMGQYVPAGFPGRVIVDFVDVDSAKFDAYAARGRGVVRWVNAREARTLRAEEARLACRADASLLITRDEADLFTARLPEAARARADVRVMGNGIDSEGFDPERTLAEGRLSPLPHPRLIFTGQMDYAPNVDAVVRVVDRIMPRVLAMCPEASFHVVGRKPAAAVLERDGVNGCKVWGRVDDIRPWLKGADMALVPLEIARGVQNKVLEAMAMALPVVLTSGAATGIDGTSGRHFAVADSDEDLARAVLSLVARPRTALDMGQAARQFVIDRQSWHAALADLPDLVSPGRKAARRAA